MKSVDATRKVKGVDAFQCHRCLHGSKTWHTSCQSCGATNSYEAKVVPHAFFNEAPPKANVRRVPSFMMPGQVPGMPPSLHGAPSDEDEDDEDGDDDDIEDATLEEDDEDDDDKGVSVTMDEVVALDYEAVKTGIQELDELLSEKGGVALGTNAVFSSPPGTGKSTLLAQALCNIVHRRNCIGFYGSGEESAAQVKARMIRAKCYTERVGRKLVVSTKKNIDRVAEEIIKSDCRVFILDSIQQYYTNNVSRSNEMAQGMYVVKKMTEIVRERRTGGLLINQSTKDGKAAGSQKALHECDAIFFLEPSDLVGDDRIVIIRGKKNRTGPAIVRRMLMTATGMRPCTEIEEVTKGAAKDGDARASVGHKPKPDRVATKNSAVPPPAPAPKTSKTKKKKAA